MLSKAFSINFQPENSAVTLPSGWLKDTGATYADRGNGRSYGWSCDLSEDTRERLVHSAYRKRGNSSNPLLDTSIIFDRLEACATTYWSIALTPGAYLVQVGLGDVTYSWDATGCTVGPSGGAMQPLSGTPHGSPVTEMIVSTQKVTIGAGQSLRLAGITHNP